MDHTYIEENNLIERYGQGRLLPEEEMRFEEHFVGCERCQEELVMERSFRRGMKRAVIEEAQVRTATQLGVLAWLARATRRPQAGWMLALLLAVTLLPAVWFGQQNVRLRQQVDSASTDAKTWQERYSATLAEREELEHRQVAAEERWNEERQRLEARIDESATPAPSPAPSLGPQANTPLFLLGKMRSDDGQANVIERPDDAEYLNLAVDVYTDPRYLDYQVEILDDSGGVVWQQAKLIPNALEVLMVTFPRDFFRAGRYRLAVSGHPPSGAVELIDSYPFEVLP